MNALDEARARFATTAMPCAVVDDYLSTDELDQLQSDADALPWQRMRRVHFGSYAFSHRPPSEPVIERLTEVIGAIADTKVELVATRFDRLEHRDYSLALDDRSYRAGLPPIAFEAVLDLSAAATGEAQVVYTHRGQGFFSPPQQPRSLALVARTPTVGRFDRYLTHRVGDRQVSRVRLLFARR